VSAPDTTAIIDIGSNSIRLVVYSGNRRSPSIIFNEKVLAGLGSKLSETGRLSSKGQSRALAALERFSLLIDEIGVGQVRTFATAAVREASNGAEFMGEVQGIGLKGDVLSACEEAQLAGAGVLSAIPNAHGIVGDLGGGSLELVEVAGSEVGRSISLPVGILRVPDSSKGEVLVTKVLENGLAKTSLKKFARGKTFYLVGGSWRSLARLDIAATDYPLPIAHQYRMEPSRPKQLRKLAMDLGKLAKAVPLLSPGRVPTMPVAAMILSCVTQELKPRSLVVSSFGIREGLLYSALTKQERALDPLIEAARDASVAARRFEEHGDALDAWIEPIFDDRAALRRLRLASCILADAAWQAHPDFRAERGVDLALHGNWVAADASARVLMAQALYSNFGAQELLPNTRLLALCKPEDVERAHRWGLAMRLGQRLCGGVAAALRGTKLRLARDTLELCLHQKRAALAGESVERRLARLADAMGLKPAITID